MVLRLSLRLRQTPGFGLVGLLLRGLHLFVHALVPVIGDLVTAEESHSL